MPKISVIIPIYNVEQYIERCAVSLFEQTIDDIEYVFVNDCTPDNSVQILQKVMERYPERKANIKIINHDKNRGSAAARNTGLNNATGEYIGWCDSDDWVEKDMYEALYEKAKSNNADIVISDFYWDTEEIKQNIKSNISKNCVIDLFNGNIAWSFCNKLFKRSLCVDNNVLAIEGLDMGEDMYIISRLFILSQNVSYVSKSLYHYEQNIGKISITSNKSIKKLEQLYTNIYYLNLFLYNNNYLEQYNPHFYFWVLSKKRGILEFDYKYWDLYNILLPIPMRYILQQHGIKKRILDILMKYKLYWFVKMILNK